MYHVVIGCRVFTYMRVRTSRKMVMRAGRDILVVGSIAAGEQEVLNQETSGGRALPEGDHTEKTEIRHECSAFLQKKHSL
jgi:hypothetical protein